MSNPVIHTIRHIAQSLGAEAAGDLDFAVTSAAEPARARADQIALAMTWDYAADLPKGNAVSALLWPGADWQGMGLRAAIFAPRSRLAMAGVTRLFDPGPAIAPGIHPMSVVGGGAQIGAGAAIGPFVTIGADVIIGAGARIASHVSVADGARIGADALILNGVRIGPGVVIGDRVILHPGAVIGSDGFSFVTPEKSGVEEIRKTHGQRESLTAQHWVRIHSLGSVVLADDVEVGANACIDRGTIRNTTVGARTKIDNLVHIGHNVQIGDDCLLCAQVGIAGSSRIGNRVVLAGQCGVNDNIFVGDDVIAGGASKIFTNAPAGRVMLGYPAVPMEVHLQMQKALRRLPRFMTRITEEHADRQKAVSKPDQGA